MSLNEAKTKYNILKTEWEKNVPNLSKCGELLSKLKVSLTHLEFLPTSDSDEVRIKPQLILARDILEIGALYSITTKDITSFERYLAQLKCYYFDYQAHLLESAFKYQLLGLNLLCLLSQNRVADFHTELELLPAKEIQKNVYIRHPVSLEQYLMEGSYNKVFLSKGNVPAKHYTFFIDILLDTIREEIGACIEKAYERINIQEAARLLFFDNIKQMTEFAKKREWDLNNDNILQFNTIKKETQTANKIPAIQLASQAIDYAKELEMIV